MIKEADWSNLFILKFEKGYIVLNKIISVFGNENFFLFVVATITLSGVYFSIKRYSKNYFFSVFIFITFQFFIFQFSGLRQSIAFSIVLMSLKYIQERKLFKFIITIIIASTFHKTAIIFIPAYWMVKNRITPKSICIFLETFIFLYIVKGPILMFITKYMYSTYDVSTTAGGYTMLVLLFGIFIFFTLIRNKNAEVDKNNDIWFNMLMISILIQSLASTQGNIARLTMYYSYSLLFLIPNEVHNIENSKQRILVKTIVYVLLLCFFITNIQMETLYIPYKTFF